VLVLDDGSEVEADVVVATIGERPDTRWLESAGLDVSDGVLCEENLRVVGADDVVAAGTVARWPNVRYSPKPRRVGQWIMALEQGRAAAASLLGSDHPSRPAALIPRFWSEQFGLRIQVCGEVPVDGSAEMTVSRQRPGRRDTARGGVLVGYHRDGEQIGVVGVNAVRAFTTTARMILAAPPRLIRDYDGPPMLPPAPAQRPMLPAAAPRALPPAPAPMPSPMPAPAPQPRMLAAAPAQLSAPPPPEQQYQPEYQPEPYGAAAYGPGPGSYPQEPYPQEGYGPEGYGPDYPPEGYPPQGYPPEGYGPEAYGPEGYGPAEGYGQPPYQPGGYEPHPTDGYEPVAYGPPEQYGQEQYDPAVYAPPEYEPAEYAPVGYGPPEYGQPEYGPPEYGQPGYGPPQYEPVQYEPVVPQYPPGDYEQYPPEQYGPVPVSPPVPSRPHQDPYGNAPPPEYGPPPPPPRPSPRDRFSTDQFAAVR
jgi:hypothetical protein